MHSLPVLLRLNEKPVILVGTGDAADAKRRLLERAGAVVVGEKEAAQIAIVAIEDDGEAEAAVARLRARGILVNATDRPALCDFTLPAIIDRAPVMLAIGTGGASAGLAKALRIAIEGLLPASLGSLAERLSSVRESIRQRWPDAGDRRRAIDAALSPDGPLDPFADDSADNVDRWLAEEGAIDGNQFIEILLKSSNPDDLTLRQARLLGRADRIFYAAAVPAVILDRARADAARIPCDEAPDRAARGLTLWLRWNG